MKRVSCCILAGCFAVRVPKKDVDVMICLRDAKVGLLHTGMCRLKTFFLPGTCGRHTLEREMPCTSDRY